MSQALQSLRGIVQYDAEGRAVLLAALQAEDLTRDAEACFKGVDPMKTEDRNPPDLSPRPGAPLARKYWLVILAACLAVILGTTVVFLRFWDRMMDAIKGF